MPVYEVSPMAMIQTSNEKFPATAGQSYQDAMKQLDRSLPAYVFPHMAPSKNPNANNNNGIKKMYRKAATDQWEDNSLADWPEDDYRIFIGDLGNEVSDEVLIRHFAKYGSFQKARVIRDKKTGKSRGYGFVSFGDPNDFANAVKDMNGKYIGNRPCKIKMSRWKDRADVEKTQIMAKVEKEKALAPAWNKNKRK